MKTKDYEMIYMEIYIDMAKWGNPIVESQSSWIGWPSVDENSWPTNAFWNSRNVDTRRNTREISLTEYTSNSLMTNNEIPVAYWVDEQWTTWCFTRTGGIQNGTDTYTYSTSNIYNVVQYWVSWSQPVLFIMTTNAIHKLARDFGTLPWVFTLSNWTFNNNTGNKPYLLFKSWLLIWDWDKIVKITKDDNITNSTYTPVSWALSWAAIVFNLKSTNEYIKKMFELGDQVVIFTNRWQYFWDWFNLEYDRFVPRESTIINVAQFKTTFYVTTINGTIYTLWKTSTWYDRVEIFKEDTNTPYPRLIFNTNSQYQNAMTVANWIVYFWWMYKWEVFSYGSYTPWMPETLQRHRLFDWAERVTSLYDNKQWRIYVWAYVGSTYKTGYIQTTNQWVNYFYWDYSSKDWLMEFKPILWAGRGQDKEMVKYRVWYSVESGHRIVVYGRVNDEINKFTFYCTSYTTIPVAWATYTNNGSTYTVIDSKVDWTRIWIYTQSNLADTPSNTSLTLTKTSWTWDATYPWISYVPYRLIDLIDGSLASISTKYKYAWMYSMPFNKIQFALWLHRVSGFNSPKITDFTWEYNQITNDL